jgi:predicted ATP-binding protein involved in virulence/Flp pilus assembly protein TadD
MTPEAQSNFHRNLAQFKPEDPEAIALLAQAHAAFAEADFIRAEQLLKQAKAKDAITAEEVMKRALQRLLSASESEIIVNHALPIAQQGEAEIQARLAMMEQTLGADHPDLAHYLNQLGMRHFEQAHYAEAEPLFQRGLAIREKALGNEHPDVAQSLNNLAVLYQAQGNYTAAEPLFQRSLAIRESTLEKEHPDVASSLNNLAMLYEAQGNYAATEPLLQRSLVIREKTLGKEHPDVAQSLNNLAMLYKAQGNYAEAKPLLQRNLVIRESTLGKEHPDVAVSLNNLAGIYQAQGNYAAAEPLYQRSLVILEKTLGKEHLDVAMTLNNLAMLYQDQGNYAATEPLLQRSLLIREATLGKEHPKVAQSLNNLAMLYKEQGNYTAAEPLIQRGLVILEKTLGKEHPDVAKSLNNLALLYQAQGNYADAEPLFERSLVIWEKTLGKDHLDVATILNNLAMLYQAQGNYADAEPLLQRSLVIWERTLGKEHPHVATNLNNLATLYQAQGNYAAAAPLFQRSLTICENKFGKDHPTTQLVRENSYGSRRIAVLKIEQLNVTNFKFFEASTFHFHPEFNLVVGENGKGKTSLLRALEVALGGWAHAYIKDKNNLRPIDDDEIREVQEAGRFTKSHFTQVEAQGTIKIVDYKQQDENGNASWTRTRQAPNKDTFTKGQLVADSGMKNNINFARLGTDVLHYIEQGQSFDLPLIVSYRCDRLRKTSKKFNPEAAAKKRYSRFDPYRDCFHTGADLIEVATWVLKEDMQSKEQDTPAFQAFQVAAKAAIENCTRIRFDQSRIVLDFEDGSTIPLEHLSDGQRTIIGLFCDLTRRAVIMNPHLGGNVCAETSGIVLIDELDLHLHPKWQRGIIENLRKTFPKVQFICTTHSPFLIQSLRSGDELMILDDNVHNVEFINRSIEDIIEWVMRVSLPQRSERLQRMYEVAKQYYSLLQEAESADETTKNELKTKLDELSAPFSENVAYHAFLEMERLAAGLGKSRR